MTENDIKKRNKEAEVSELIRQLPTGLLRWYPFVSDKRALYIGEPGDAMAEMLRDDKSLRLDTFSVEDIEGQKSDDGYDYIICIACLELLEDAAGAIQGLKALLKTGGVMLLGFNNRLGIRYFTGDSDPYTEKVFDGIEGYIRAGDHVSFFGKMYAKSEIEGMLDEAGLEKRKCFSVLTDLYNPTFLFSDTFLPNEDLSNRVIPTYNSPDTVFLNEVLLYRSLIENGMFHKMANAYLVECTGDGILSDVLHVTCSMERGKEDALITVIHDNDTVTKQAAFTEGEKRLEKLIENAGKLKKRGIRVIEAKLENGVYTMPFIKGKNGQLYLRELLETDKEKFLKTMDHFRDLILKSSLSHEGLFGDSDKSTLLLDEAIFDMVPLNSFYFDGDFVFYDQEFCIPDYPANIIITRMIASFYVGSPAMAKLLPRDELFKRYGVYDELSRWQEPEWDFLTKLRKQDELAEYHAKVRADAGTVSENRFRMDHSARDHRRIFEDIFANADAKKLAVFGSGQYAKSFIERYAGTYDICAVVDNNGDKWGQDMDGISGVKIQSPDALREISEESIKVMVCVRDFQPVLGQLESMGIQDYSVYDPGKKYAVQSQRMRICINPESEAGTGKPYHIGYIAGAFDMFHIGHLNLARRAKERCDYLIAGVMSDARMYNLKKKYPVIPCNERMMVVAGCRYVDRVEELPADRAGIMDAYRMFHFDCMFSGDDHADNPGWLAERERLRQEGSDIVFVSYTKETSSSAIREKMRGQDVQE